LSPAGDPAAEEWSQWSVCSLTCGQGSQVRTRSCVSSPYGTLCSGLLRETRTCNNTATCPVPGVWEEWSPWSLCSVTCGRGARTRTRRCAASRRRGKACEGPHLQAKPCNIATCPVEGQWLEWGAWSRCSVTCANGTQQRTRKCSVSAHGWAECRGAHADARECSNPTCPTDSKWGPWNHWSLCSKTCDTGWQRRFRMCEGTGMQGYPCEGTGEEVKTCNEKKCPAYHEMCKDEYVMLMTWKKTAAGEIIYNKCPPNATATLNTAGGWREGGGDSRVTPLSPPRSQLREHLAKGQRVLAGEGMSQVVRSLLELMSRKTYYSGDLLFSVDILRNVTDTFKRATYIPSSEDVQRFFQVVSYMVDAENRDKWEDAQQAFQSSLIVTDNLVTSIQREPVSAVSSDINFPMKGRRGMKDWARSSEDKLFIPREVLSLASAGEHPGVSLEDTKEPHSPVSPARARPLPRVTEPVALPAEAEESSHFVIGAVLYRTLGLILPPPRSPLAVTSKVLTVTVRPPTRPAEPLVLVELSHIVNGTSHPQCVTWDYSRTDAGLGNWDTESCQTLETLPAHTKCQCRQLATFAVLAQLPKDLVGHGDRLGTATSLPGTRDVARGGVSAPSQHPQQGRFIKSERSIILLNFCVSILASNILILVGQSQMLSKGVCTMTAAFLHFFFLSSFCWVLTEAWQSYLAVIGRIRTRLVRKRFLCLGWGLPALVVAVSVGFTRTKGYGTASYCWLSLEGGPLSPQFPAGAGLGTPRKRGQLCHTAPATLVGRGARLGGLPRGSGVVLGEGGVAVPGQSHPSGSPRPLSPCARASLWSSCVVLPLLALTWMSAVLAMTDRRSILFQVLFAVFNSVQGFVIITVHGFLRREVQDVVKCQMGGCRSEENENSPDSCKNGQVQILTDFEKDVDLACQTVLFKEVNTCNPATITGTLSRISLDGDEDPKLNTTSEGGLGFSSLPGNIPPASILVQVPKMTPNVVAGLTELGEPPAQQLGLEAPGPVYLCTESSLRPLEYGWIRAPEPPRESDYMMLPRRTGSLKPFPRDEGTLGGGGGGGGGVEEAVPGGTGRPAAEGDAYPGFVAVDHVNVNLNQPYATVKAPYGLQFKQHPTVRQILASELSERSRTMPRTVPGSAMKVGSLERKRLRYSDLDFEKVMHTRKRHSELYHELNQKFHTLDRYRAPSTGSSKREKRWSVSSGGGDKSTGNDVTSPEEQRQKAPAAPPKPWSTFKAMTLGSLPSAQRDRLELCRADWDSPCAGLDGADGDFQTEV
ncbi:AGRB2 protein, partial [Leiothrix lutea]|nr:AGRB2 protein [Leiothrix lutea]